MTAGVDSTSCLLGYRSDCRDLAVADADIAARASLSGAIDDGAIDDLQVEHGH
jgi:hypothetical protein